MHPHTHRNLYDIYTIIDRLQSSDKVKQLARRIFEIVRKYSCCPYVGKVSKLLTNYRRKYL